MYDIKITQFVNPHLFFYELEEHEMVKKPFEEEMVKNLPDGDFFMSANPNYNPSPGEIVGHYNIIENKWMRAQVDHITYTLDNEKVYFLFALDYGYSLESIGKWLWPLPKEYQAASQKIFMGGIKNVIPCDLWVNPITAKQEFSPSKQWNTGAVMHLIRLMDSCHAIKFSPEFKVANGQHFGTLQFKTITLEDEDAGESLVRANLALESRNFVADLVTLRTRDFKRWQRNDRNAVSFGLSTLSRQMMPMSVAKARNDDGGDIESFFVDAGDSTTGKCVRKLTRHELGYFRKQTNAKVLSWQEQNAKYFTENPVDNTQGKEKVTEMMEMLDKCVVDEKFEGRPCSLLANKWMLMKKHAENSVKIDEPRKMNIQALFEEASLKPQVPPASLRAATKPKPAGYIYNPMTDN